MKQKGCGKLILYAHVNGGGIRCGHRDLDDHVILCAFCEYKRLKEKEE